jgi:hypothetical protein
MKNPLRITIGSKHTTPSSMGMKEKNPQSKRIIIVSALTKQRRVGTNKHATILMQRIWIWK